MPGSSDTVSAAESSSAPARTHEGDDEAVSNGRIPLSTDNTLKASRILTIRLMPDREQLALLRRRASQAAAYRNQHMQARRADAVKWRVPESAERPTLVRHVRQTEQGELGAAIYLACEAEVRKDWRRAGRAIMAGAPMPQYRQRNSLAIASAQGGGVRIVAAPENRFIAQLNVGQGGQWIDIPVHPHTDRDPYRQPKLTEMAQGRCQPLLARVILKPSGGKTLLQLTYSITRQVKSPGERCATLSEFEDGRLLLRVENGGTLDYSSRLAHVKSCKGDWEGIRRRFGSHASRRKGHARQLRRQLDQFGWGRKMVTLMHQWSADMVRWMVDRGVGSLSIPALLGTDWPATLLKTNLTYKCHEAGIQLVEATPSQEPTERAAGAAIRKQRRKIKKLSEAIRTVQNALPKEPS